jgi:hypothetical protein
MKLKDHNFPLLTNNIRKKLGCTNFYPFPIFFPYIKLECTNFIPFRFFLVCFVPLFTPKKI